MKSLVVPSSVSLLLLASACTSGDDKGGGGGGVPGTAHIVRGASDAETAFAPLTFGTAAIPADGDWRISPDGGRATLLSLQMGLPGTPGSTTVQLTDCTPEYHRADPSNTAMLDCEFTVPSGTYNGFGVSMVNAFEILIDDPANGFYTDPSSSTLLSTTPPAGGAAYVTVDNTASQETVGLIYALYPPLVVDSQEGITVTIAADMIHTMEIRVAGGVPSFLPQIPAPIVLVGSPTGIAKSQYFTTLGTIDSYKWREPPINPDTLRVFYTGDGSASVLAASPSDFFTGGSLSATLFAYAVDPADLTTDNLGQKPGGYLGVDGSGTLCWAQGTSFAWDAYRAVYALPPVTVIGSSALLARDDVNPAPLPADGETYASGCPAMTPDATVSLTLAAQ